MNSAPVEAPYGSWKSPITAAVCVGASGDFSQLVGDGDELYYLESLATENGRLTLRRLSDGAELTPAPINVRSRVNEYGGGSYHARDGYLAWCDDALGGSVTLRDPDGETRYLTEAGAGYVYGDLRVHPELGVVLAVREDHSGGGEAVTTIVAISMDDSADAVLCGGADFYGNPELSTEGELAWFEWNHPSMPWDETTLKVARLVTAGGLRLEQERVIAGGIGSNISVQFPKWISAGLVYLSDESGYWNPQLYREESRALCTIENDFCLGFWVLGNAEYSEISPGNLLVRFFEDGTSKLALLNVASRELTPLGDAAYVESVATAGRVGYAKVAWPDASPGIIRISPELGRGLEQNSQVDNPVYSVGDPESLTDKPSIVGNSITSVGNPKQTSGIPIVTSALGNDPRNPEFTSIARPLWIEGQAGKIHAWYYPPTNANFASPDELPPMIVNTHGGPTALAKASFDPSKQFWTSRGFSILDVNYSGSSGFGRKYRQRLNSNWGVIDVADVVSCVEYAISNSLADPKRVAISGSSAGGYLTLQSLVSSELFAAGVSLYGIADLNLLVEDTHKFESRYPENLLGRDEHGELPTVLRSPIHHLGQLSSPLLILQGTDDKIVPPNQATELAHAAEDAGLPVALIMFDGEGHGFRQTENRIRSLESQLSFYAQIFGFTPADAIEPIEIKNLT